MLSRAMAVRQIGEVRFGQGQLETALAAFSESRETLRRLFEADESIDDYLSLRGYRVIGVNPGHAGAALFGETVREVRRESRWSRFSALSP